MKSVRIKQQQEGFTLIELMIVVAIVGILAAIAIPAYQSYVISSQVTEAINLAAGKKAVVTQYYAVHGKLPDGSSLTLIQDPNQVDGTYVKRVDINQYGAIVATFQDSGDVNKALEGLTLAIVPSMPSTGRGTLNWECVSEISGDYLPATCREDSGASKTTYQGS